MVGNNGLLLTTEFLMINSNLIAGNGA